MYKIKIPTGNIYTIPKQNLKLLAMIKSQDLKKNVKLDTEKDILDFFNSIGIIVEEI